MAERHGTAGSQELGLRPQGPQILCDPAWDQTFSQGMWGNIWNVRVLHVMQRCCCVHRLYSTIFFLYSYNFLCDLLRSLYIYILSYDIKLYNIYILYQRMCIMRIRGRVLSTVHKSMSILRTDSTRFQPQRAISAKVQHRTVLRSSAVHHSAGGTDACLCQIHQKILFCFSILHGFTW